MKWRITKKGARRWLIATLIGYLLVGIALYFLQEKFLFHPETIAEGQPLKVSQPHEELRLPVTNERLIHVTRFPVPDSTRKGLIIYFHGNRGSVERHAPQADLFLPHGWEVWMPDYPGYGKSTGPRTEQSIKEEAELVYKLARSRFAANSIIIYGRSMGSGPATWLASRVDCRRLVLESPYTSIPDLMRDYTYIYPTSLMSKYQFNNAEILPEVDAPISIFHGTADNTISIKHARRLNRIGHSKTSLIEIKAAGHNNLPEFPLFFDEIEKLLE